MEDLNGRGRTVLPAAYVAAHADYGWAITIDAAQGATTDLGIVLARPGIDSEHLYVGMTRGREANHVYVTTDPATEPDHHHGPRPDHQQSPQGVGGAERTPKDRARDLLAAALATSGAQDAAHTARDAARARAAEHARTEAARRAAAERAAALVQAAMPPEHAARLALLAQRRAEADQLRADQTLHRQQLQQATAELANLPRFSRSRRANLTATIGEHHSALAQSLPVQARLSTEINELDRQVERHARELQHTANRSKTRRPGRNLFGRPTLELARPRSITAAADTRDELEVQRSRDLHYERERRLARERDDGRGMSR